MLFSVLLSPPAAAAPSFTGSWYEDVGTVRDEDTVEEPLFLPVSATCQVAALTSLGWKVERMAGGNQVLYAGGNPCDNSSLAESRAEGELLVQIPAGIDEGTLQGALSTVLSTQASVCAYKFKVGFAALRASNKLRRNENFYFFSGGFPYIEFTRGDKWWGGCMNGGAQSCYYPRVSNSEAMQEFATGRIGTECALGLQAAEYSTLRVLYGDSAFNRKFRSDEITLAPWTVLNHSASATWGNMTSVDTITDTAAVETAKLGAGGFIGVSGYIGNVYGEAYLDNPVDRGENYLTVSVSLTAAAELKARGGFAAYNVMNTRLFELGKSLNPGLERLTLTTVDADTIQMSAYQRLVFKEMQQILKNPVYSAYFVYVHPLGILSLGEHIVRLLERNPRTPYAFTLYPSKMNRGQYVRYVNSILADCR